MKVNWRKECNTNREKKREEQILAPSLEAGQIVVMDNLSVHKSALVRQLIEARGCALLFLPTYSPDYSPIEETFSKLKALETVMAAGALGWFHHCNCLPTN